MIFYRSYPCAPKATLLSGFANIAGFFSAFFAIALATRIPGKPVMILPVILLAGLAAAMFIYVGRKLTDKLAETETQKNVTTKPRFAAVYCSRNPGEYDRIAQINPEFGRLYEKDDRGRIVKRKYV